MSARQLTKGVSWPASACVALLLVLAGCSQDSDQSVHPNPEPSEQQSASARNDESTADSPSSAPPDAQIDEADYEDDAGTTLDIYEYPDDPEPAEEMSATLCNLNQEYFTSLRAETDDGEPVVDDNLRLAVLSTRDNLDLWEAMRSHFPDLHEAIDTASEVGDYWDTALMSQENGDAGAAAEAMLQADEAIDALPNVDSMGEFECLS